jgi:pyridoxal phosphate enzyme (YggS family)
MDKSFLSNFQLNSQETNTMSEQLFYKQFLIIKERIAIAAESAKRNVATIELLPVTKFHPPEVVQWCANAGLLAVGENRVQEAASKRELLGKLGQQVRWELIGHLQSNKAKLAVQIFDRIQSVDSVKLIERLARLAGESERILPVLLQFNTGRDSAKSGFEVEEAEAAAEAIMAAPELAWQGLMTIAPLSDDPALAQRAFAGLRELRDSLSSRFAIELPVLSMGMTSDLECAIKEGSTQIRIGTALFGERQV